MSTPDPAHRGFHAALVLGLTLMACNGQRGDPPAPHASTAPPAASTAPPADAPAPGPPRTTTGFRAPSALERHHAIGAVLSPLLERALYVHDSFEPMTAPEPGDWLAEHLEAGQTFAQFVASRPNRPASRRSTIYFLPIGDFEPGRSPPMHVLRDHTRAFFSLPVRVLPAVSVDELGVTSRIHDSTGRPQLLSSDILAYLKTRLPDDAHSLIALTQVDLYPEESWNFVFGQASLREHVGVHSFARYHPVFHGDTADRDTDRIVLLRSLKVLAHEIGHMFGIQHCIYFQCVLNGSNSLSETDRQPLHLCPVELRKLVHSISFNPLDRYRALRKFYRKHGLDEQARWVEGRIDELTRE